MGTLEERLKALCDRITGETQAALRREGLGCQANLDNAVARFRVGKKYAKVDVGPGGKYMVENGTGDIYGIKAYGVVHRGHCYGNLDTAGDYFWGGYIAIKL